MTTALASLWSASATSLPWRSLSLTSGAFIPTCSPSRAAAGAAKHKRASDNTRAHSVLRLIGIKFFIVDGVLNLSYPAVSPRDMAAGGTFPAIAILHVIRRQIPAAVMDGIPYMLGVVARMDF